MVDVIVLTLTGIFKRVVTGQAPVTLEWKNTPGEKSIGIARRAKPIQPLSSPLFFFMDALKSGTSLS